MTTHVRRIPLLAAAMVALLAIGSPAAHANGGVVSDGPTCKVAGEVYGGAGYVESRYCIADVRQYPTYRGWSARTAHHCGFFPFNEGRMCTEVLMTHAAWRPTSTGWSRTDIAEGTPVYVHPYGTHAGWRWIWTRQTGWAAMESGDLVLYWKTRLAG